MVEVDLFTGVAGLILASLVPVGWFLKIARDLEKDADVVVNEKASILDEHFFRVVSTLSTNVFYKLLRGLGQFQVGNKTVLDILKSDFGGFLDELLKGSPDAIAEQMDNLELPAELVSMCRLSDEDKDRLFSISFLAFQLKDTVPELFSVKVDEMIKGIIAGILCGIAVGSVSLLMSYNLMQYLSVIIALILLTATLYFYFGILGIWSLRKLEKKLLELKKENDIEDVWQTVMEMTEYE
jgi:hypothetical protein